MDPQVKIRQHIRHCTYMQGNRSGQAYTPWPSWTRFVPDGSLMTIGYLERFERSFDGR
jgi:hypothetical protein